MRGDPRVRRMIRLSCHARSDPAHLSIRTRRPRVYLDDQDLERLEGWTSERGWTKSQAIRSAVRALTRCPAGDPLLDLSGDIDGLPANLSARFDRYLDATLLA